ncbi:MAG: hypothetical protein C4567_11205 [Deltaproteobacteria bacterium]|nr:MAG: hypothetical protein C4567_11205 [Deltaproteobacteria bacterium]
MRSKPLTVKNYQPASQARARAKPSPIRNTLMAVTNHHIANTVKDIYIFTLGLNAAPNYLQEIYVV